MLSEPEFIQRFVQEARTTSALNHPNICTIYDIIESEKHHFIVMEFVEGKTLREILNLQGRLTTDAALKIVLKVGDGLNVAHSKHIIHRDVKPENIMITEDGLVKIMDFGLAKLKNFQEIPIHSTGSINGMEIKRDSFKTSKSTVLGTISYMSPEQIKNEQLMNERTFFLLESFYLSY